MPYDDGNFERLSYLVIDKITCKMKKRLKSSLTERVNTMLHRIFMYKNTFRNIARIHNPINRKNTKKPQSGLISFFWADFNKIRLKYWVDCQP